MPAAYSLLYSVVLSVLSPRASSARAAFSYSLPTQLPTLIGCRPMDTTRSTIAPGLSVVPTLGSEEMTMPSLTFSE